MKLLTLKLKKEKVPQLDSLHPPLFDLNKYWFLLILSIFLVLVVTSLTGIKIFYSVYSEEYKTKSAIENADTLISLNRIKQTIKLRTEFINSKIDIPRDPSI